MRKGGLATSAACACAGASRLVTHVDERFLARVTQLYRQRLPEGQLT